MTAKVYLRVVEEPDLSQHTTLKFQSEAQMLGHDDEHLACGSCKKLIARNMSTRTFAQNFPADDLLLQCVCGAYLAAPKI